MLKKKGDIIVWTTAILDDVLITDMDDKHLYNTINLIGRRGFRTEYFFPMLREYNARGFTYLKEGG